jgi:hypothetical protein
VLILRIKQAETALKDKRLDEACELARAEDFKTHRDGQRLIGDLVREFLARGREHLSGNRLNQALADCDKAERLGGNLPELADLRSQVTQALQSRQQAERRKAGLLAAARQQIHDGWLSLGQQALEGVEGSGVEPLQEEAELRRAKADKALTRAEQALNRQDWATAIDSLREARQAHSGDPRIGDLMDKAIALVAEQTGSAIDQGRLDAAQAMLRRLESLTRPTLQIGELGRFVADCQTAASRLDHGQPRQAAEILHRLSLARPTAGWLAEACRQADEAATSMEGLRRGPLGWMTGMEPVAAYPATAMNEDQTAILAPARHPENRAAGNAIPDRFMLHVDAVGGFLVMRQPRITIGPISSSRHPDLALLADAGLPVITIERQEEDYFLSSESPVRVNDTLVQRKLLTNGDRILLGPRCLLKLTLPSAASTSAVLHLSGCRLPSGDARRVILMDRSIVISPGSVGHIRADRLTGPAVLHIRDGRLLVRSTAEVRVNDQPMDDRVGIPVGASASIGPISLAVAKAEARA